MAFDREEYEQRRHEADPYRYMRYKDFRRRNLISQRKSRSGWTEEMVVEAWEEQQGLCAICGRGLESKEKAHADHDHVEKIPRGLLCKLCNSRVGWFEENQTIIIQYILKYRPAKNGG